MRSIMFGLLLAGSVWLPARAQDAAPASAPASASAGEKDFVVCRACHQIGPTAKNAVGPVLNGVLGRPAGSYPGYAYSAANKNSGLTWDAPTLEKYLASPQTVVPHTKMIFPGLHDPQKVKDVIAFLGQYGPDGQKQ